MLLVQKNSYSYQVVRETLASKLLVSLQKNCDFAEIPDENGVVRMSAKTKIAHTLCCSMFAVILISCKQQANFAGSTKNQTPAKPAQDAKPAATPVVEPPKPVTPDCKETGVTVAQLLSNQIFNGAAQQVLRYRLSMKDCAGQQTPITAHEILFDINGRVPAGTTARPLQYTVSAESGSNGIYGNLASGQLATIRGQDLFGVANPQFWHYRTNQPIAVNPQMKSVIFTVDISGLTHHTFNAPFPYIGPKVEVIDTILRFGTATPVKQPVNFVNP